MMTNSYDVSFFMKYAAAAFTNLTGNLLVRESSKILRPK